METYLYFVAIINFLVDYLLILATDRISGYAHRFQQATLAALVGAAGTVGGLLPGFSFLTSTLWRMVCIGLMSLIAFGWERSTLRRGVLFFFLSMAMSGFVLGLGNGSFGTVLLAAALIVILCRFGFGGKPGRQQYVPVTIAHHGKCVQLTALVDTGNTLRDPVTGQPVLVVDAEIGDKLMSLTEDQLRHPLETIASRKIRGLRLIPYSTVGQDSGMLIGLRVEKLLINGKQVNMIVAFAPRQIGRGQVYQALAGGYTL